jgi:nitroreductase
MTRVLQFLMLCCAALGLGAAASAVIPVPDPPERGGRTLLECQWKRHSTRRFVPDPLPAGTLARILWAADGVNRPDGKKRTAPSAFECYPITIYVVKTDRVYRYEPLKKALSPLGKAADPGTDYRRVVLGSSGFAVAPVLLILTADLSVFPDRATPAMREPWAHAECGAIGQNVYLTCADLGLGTVFAAVMRPEPVRDLLSLKEGVQPVYLMPIGKPQQDR